MKKIEGASVDNRIELLPTSPMNDHLRLALFHAIYSEPRVAEVMPFRPCHPFISSSTMGTSPWKVVVSSEAEKSVANIRANGVPNVFSVTENLPVEK